MGKMLVIEGVMGVGKTTLLNRLKEEIDMPCVEQDFEHNICLDDFYAGTDCAFQKQMIFLFSNYHILFTAEQKFPNFASDFCFERSLVMSRAILTEQEKELYEENYSYLKQNLRYRKLIIFLHGDKNKIINNIRKRGRPFESKVMPNYIETCQQALIDNLNHLGADQIIDINIDEIDILSNECINYLLPKIREFLDNSN